MLINLEYLPEFKANHSHIEYDYQILGKSLHSLNSITVLLAIAEKQLISKRVAAVKKLGIKVKMVDIESLAIARACQLLSIPNNQNESSDTLLTIICHIKTSHLSLVVLQNFIPIYINTLNISDQEEPAVQIHSIIKCLHHFLGNLQTHNPSFIINHIILCGDNQNLVAITAAINAEFHYHCMTANPFTQLTIAENCDKNTLLIHAPQMMVCCGLAMRA